MTNATGESGERQRLTAVQGLAALSLDALSSVAYGPEAILVVLVAASSTVPPVARCSPQLSRVGASGPAAG